MENATLLNKIHKANPKALFLLQKTQTFCEKLFEEEE